MTLPIYAEFSHCLTAYTSLASTFRARRTRRQLEDTLTFDTEFTQLFTAKATIAPTLRAWRARLVIGKHEQLRSLSVVDKACGACLSIQRPM